MDMKGTEVKKGNYGLNWMSDCTYGYFATEESEDGLD